MTIDLLDLAGLAPVGLDELDERAALLTRQDNKYLVPLDSLAAVVADLGASHQVLEVAGLRHFRYDSVYFDTADLTLHHDHVQGRRLRWKVRTRRYDDSGLCFQEIKLKGLRGETVKLRRRIPVEEHGLTTDSLVSFVDATLREHYGRPVDVPLRPTVTVRYSRSTLASLTGQERVTCDTALTVVDTAGRQCGRLDERLALLEVKTERGRGRADAALLRRRLRPASLSKYGVAVGLAGLSPVPASLRRVVRTGFREEPGPVTARPLDRRSGSASDMTWSAPR